MDTRRLIIWYMNNILFVVIALLTIAIVGMFFTIKRQEKEIQKLTDVLSKQNTVLESNHKLQENIIHAIARRCQ